MSKPENRMLLNRREAMLLSAAAGMGLAMSRPAHASDSTKTQAHQDPGDCSTPRTAVAKTQYGRVRGFVSGGVFTFKGVPYGQTTGGENRWLPAKPPVPWKDEYPALIYGPNCPQRHHDWTGIEQTFLQDWDDGYQSEEMLKLNIWTPSLSGSRAVMVYFHGGGFEFGSAYELPSQDGAQMARNHDVVSVTVNHRLNVLAYLDLTEVGGAAYEDSVNIGLLDLVAALRWIQQNIASFGGDPSRVMIYGQSGGAGKVSNLMGMPAAAGLFQRAASHSGGYNNIPTVEMQREFSRRLVKELGLAPNDIGALQKMEWSRLYAAGNSLAAKMNPPWKGLTGPGVGLGSDARVGWMPTLDGRNITMKSFFDSAPEISKDVPFMVGCVSGREHALHCAAHRGRVARQPHKGHRRREGRCAHGGHEEGAPGKEHPDSFRRRGRPFEPQQRGPHGEDETRSARRARLPVLLHVAFADARRPRRSMAHRRPGLLLRQHQTLRAGHR